MLRQSKDLQDLAVVATDGAIGDVKDFFFDDEAWAIRYLVIDAGSWISSRKVLISPIAAGKPDWASKVLPVSLTREQVKNSPDIDTEMPVTRQHETDYLDYYSRTAPRPEQRRASALRTLTCAAANPWSATTSKPVMARSGTCRACSSTKKAGPSDTWL